MGQHLEQLASDAPTERVVEILNRDGGVIVESLLDAATVNRFNQELDPLLDAAKPDRGFLNPALEWFFGKRTRHITAVASKSGVFVEEVLCNPTLLGVCDKILRPSCARYQLNLAHVLDRGPGAEAQILHRDELVWVNFPRPHPELQIASMLALVDFTRANGATRLIPGSHQWELGRTPDESEVVYAEMPAGSAVIYLGSTLHGGGANSTQDQWRRGMHLSYVLGWLRTEENHYLATPPEIARTLPRQAQELLGYAAHDALAMGGGYLGALNLRDPADMLADGSL
ncbi:MAG: phytanoyl-CoA dioxygenase family protein [Myxococcales bacterium]|nr:phytanoyl-CoA dioxygenase family protein [Myxococcales bacterium]